MRHIWNSSINEIGDGNEGGDNDDKTQNQSCKQRVLSGCGVECLHGGNDGKAGMMVSGGKGGADNSFLTSFTCLHGCIVRKSAAR